MGSKRLLGGPVVDHCSGLSASAAETLFPTPSNSDAIYAARIQETTARSGGNGNLNPSCHPKRGRIKKPRTVLSRLLHRFPTARFLAAQVSPALSPPKPMLTINCCCQLVKDHQFPDLAILWLLDLPILPKPLAISGRPITFPRAVLTELLGPPLNIGTIERKGTQFVLYLGPVCVGRHSGHAFTLPLTATDHLIHLYCAASL